MEFTMPSRLLPYLFLIFINSLVFTVGGFGFDYDPDYFNSIAEIDGVNHVETVMGPKGTLLFMYQILALYNVLWIYWNAYAIYQFHLEPIDDEDYKSAWEASGEVVPAIVIVIDTILRLRKKIIRYI